MKNMNVEKLIEEVRKYPVLYDQAHDKYKNAEYKERIWKKIATNLEQTDAAKCKKNWAQLRDQLRKTINKRATISGQAGGVSCRKYRYEDLLSFIVPQITNRETITNVETKHSDENLHPSQTIDNLDIEFSNDSKNTEMDINEKSDIIFEDNSPGPSGIKKPYLQKIRTLQKYKHDQRESGAGQLMSYILAEKEAERLRTTMEDNSKHPVDAFLAGIAPTLKIFNPYLLHEAKGRIFSIVQELELKQIMSSGHVLTPETDDNNRRSPSSCGSSTFFMTIKEEDIL